MKSCMCLEEEVLFNVGIGIILVYSHMHSEFVTMFVRIMGTLCQK